MGTVNTSKIPSLALAVSIAACCGARAEAPSIPSLVGLAGRVTVTGVEGQEVEVTAGRLVAPGTVIEVHEGGRGRLIYANGSRFDLKAGTRLVLGAEPPETTEKIVALEGRTGALGLLPLLKSPAVSSGAHAAVRVRGKKITGFQASHQGSQILVTFDAVPEATHYRVEVETKGAVVFREVVAAPRIAISLESLGGARLFDAVGLRCVVRTHDGSGDIVEGSVELPWTRLNEPG